MNDTQKTIDELKGELHDIKIAIEKLSNSNKKSLFTRFKIWLKKTDNVGLSNYDMIVAVGSVMVIPFTFIALAALLIPLMPQKTTNDEPITIQAKVDITQDADAKK